MAAAMLCQAGEILGLILEGLLISFTYLTSLLTQTFILFLVLPPESASSFPPLPPSALLPVEDAAAGGTEIAAGAYLSFSKLWWGKGDTPGLAPDATSTRQPWQRRVSSVFIRAPYSWGSVGSCAAAERTPRTPAPHVTPGFPRPGIHTSLRFSRRTRAWRRTTASGVDSV